MEHKKAQRMGGSRNKMKYKIVVEGPALTRSGYGEHTRLVLRALRAREDVLDIYLHPLNWGTTSWFLEDEEETQWMNGLITKLRSLPDEEKKFDLHVRVGIPNEFNRLAPFSVMVTAGIETTKVDPKWIEKSHEMNKIIVPSEFAKWGFENTKYQFEIEDKGTVTSKTIGCGAPVEVVHYPVSNLDKDENFELELETDTNYLIVAQWAVRKNLENTIRWFIEEFKNDEVGLVIKTNMAKNSFMDRTATFNKMEHFLSQKEFQGRKCKIYFVHGDMTRQELNSLYTHPKIKGIISATHGEGYGLLLFEAACNGLPVVAPGWSGHLDFLYAPVKAKNGKIKKKALFARVDYVLAPVQKEAVWKDIIHEGSMWCYPNKVDFKRKIRALHTNHGMYLSWAKKLQKHILENFSKEIIHQRMLESIVPDTILNKPDYIYVSDMFSGQYNGGAELSLQAIIDSTPSRKVGAMNAQFINSALVKEHKDAKWIFGNFTQLPEGILQSLYENDVEYSFIEFDYKFCKHRNPLLYETVEGGPCDYKNSDSGKRIKEFIDNAKSVFLMSEKQREIYLESLDVDPDKLKVLSSMFDNEFFTVIEELRQKTKGSRSNTWVVLGSNSWVKGAQESEEWCKENNLDYEVLWGLEPVEFLKKLAVSKGVCFKPSGLDTCPRFVIEAKLLGCKMELNENVQHSDEEWFNKDYDGMIEYLKSRPQYFWENAF